MAPRTIPFVAAGVLAMATASSCGLLDDNSNGGDAARFCGEVAANSAALTQPNVQTTADIDVLLELYREVGAFAPLAIEAEWDQLIEAYEVASAVVPGDEQSEQAALAAIYSSESAAAAVSQWLVDTCAVDIGPIATIVPQSP
ncbi:MAG: hypothetical protein HRT86_02850 [Ilumatobacteraceae bacterium]|nr:hypothetical protein [Ilumatobacteraceae bacterium]